MSLWSRIMSGRRGLKWRLLPLVQLWFRMRGKPFVEFYAWMIDRQERKNSIEKILRESARRSTIPKFKGLYDLSDAASHTEFMISEGLQPHHTVLDFGCGFGRTAIPLIKHLEPGKFIGVEISKERLRIAKEYVTREGLDHRNPTWIRSLDLNMPYAADKSLNLVWSIAVVSHQPFDDVKIWLAACHRALADDGIVILDYLIGDSPAQYTLKDWAYTQKQMQEVIRAAGFRFEDIAADRPNFPREWAVSGMRAMRLTKS